MEVCVVGAGIVGLATAWYLRQDGHQVTLVEARDGVGLGTSYANGGQLSYRYIAPLADPDVLTKIPGWLLRADAPIRFSPSFDAAQWRWIAAFLQACNRHDHRYSTASLLPLSLYSKRLINDLVADTGFDFAWRRNGKLVMYRDRAGFAAARKTLQAHPELVGEQQALDAAQCAEVEPALAHLAHQFAGGIHTPSEEVGDCEALCRAFSGALLGSDPAVRLLLSERVLELEVESGRVKAVRTDKHRLPARCCVLAGGVGAVDLLSRCGIRAPIYPLKGYSISAPIIDDTAIPQTSVTDFQRKIVYASFGGQLRVAGMADIVGYDLDVTPARIATLKRETERNFGAGVNLACAKEWAGLRPATPTGRPILGASPIDGLWMNLGHGALGFTLAAACGRVVADRIAGRLPAVPDDAFALAAATAALPANRS